jgi:hypothetical protein
MRKSISGKRALALALFSTLSLALTSCSESPPTVMSDLEDGNIKSPIADEHGHLHDDGEFILEMVRGRCVKANAEQKAEVDLGNTFYDEFLKKCADKTGASPWCAQLTRPNPDYVEDFVCTYGEDQPHRFIHPDKSTWEHAFEAVKIVEDLQAKEINVRRIYNWWRPEPYNKNVEGAGGRHPFGTSVDVQFETQKDKNLAFKALCKMRKDGRIKAIGYYSGLGLHFGVADKIGNTWGNTCP